MAGLSKRVRFDVFKRDGFKCQYCGRTPPAVVLEVDHIVPICEGGKDHRDNLLTACFDCNRGKSGIPLESVPMTVAEKMAVKIEQSEQLKAYSRLLSNERNRETRAINDLGRFWCNQVYPTEQDKYTFGQDRVTSVRRFLRDIPATVLMDYMEKALSKRHPYGGRDDQAFRYFCGICWRQIKGEEQ